MDEVTQELLNMVESGELAMGIDEGGEFVFWITDPSLLNFDSNSDLPLTA